MMPESEAPEEPKKKRGPGRPKQDVHAVSLTITMPPGDFERLNEQVNTTGRSRSELLRMAWNGLPLTMRHEPALDEHYGQLVKLATNLNQLMSLAHLGLVTQTQVQQILSQVDQKMAELSGRGN
ncbi:plasmid mobilization protein [Hymenobacter psoromatis]|uniref:plasmid mobilization protein n=1 Tax=Hymenobacter psoromatis TaxID=1484116 RepID=UPI001CBC36CA|nr:hypothetical protein [Hymenobacter psoromatis]